MYGPEESCSFEENLGYKDQKLTQKASVEEMVKIYSQFTP